MSSPDFDRSIYQKCCLEHKIRRWTCPSTSSVHPLQDLMDLSKTFEECFNLSYMDSLRVLIACLFVLSIWNKFLFSVHRNLFDTDTSNPRSYIHHLISEPSSKNVLQCSLTTSRFEDEYIWRWRRWCDYGPSKNLIMLCTTQYGAYGRRSSLQA